MAKYDGTGHLLWVQQAGSDGNGSGHGVAVDGEGNCFLTGNFVVAAFPDLDTPCGSSIQYGINGPQDMFLAGSNFDPNGNLLWAVNGEDTNGLGSTTGFGVAVDGAGNSFVTGSFQTNAWFTSGIEPCFYTSNPQVGNRDFGQLQTPYLGEIRPSQRQFLVGAEHAADPVPSAKRRPGAKVAVDATGGPDAWIVGEFSGTVHFDTSAVQTDPSGFINAFVVKYTNVTASPGVNWAVQTTSFCHDPGTTNNANCGIQDGLGIGVDSSDNVYFTGYYKKKKKRCTAALGGFTVTDPNSLIGSPYGFSQNQLYDYFVGSLDQNGNALWLINGGQTNDNESRGIAVTPAGNVYVTGFLGSISEFGDEGQNVMLNAYDSSGAVMWTSIAQGGFTSPNQLNSGWGVAVDAAGCVYLDGGFDDQAITDPGLYFPGLPPIISSAQESLFLAKYCSVCSSTNGGGGGCTTPPTIYCPCQNRT